MPDENKKLCKPSMKGTGTVPKVRQQFNNSDEHFAANVLSNNLGRDCDHISVDSNRQYRNLPYNPFYSVMDGSSEAGSSRPNSLLNLANGVTSPSNSHVSNSGFVAKCDNVTKYPDKKQIESKLCQIREYLQVVSSLRNNFKSTDEQLQNSSVTNSEQDDGHFEDNEQLNKMQRDLIESEAKLVAILKDLDENPEYSENGDLEEASADKKTLEAASENLQILREQEAMLSQLQANAEKQLREARVAHAKLERSSMRSLENDRFNESASTKEGNRNPLVEELGHKKDQLRVENVTLQGKLQELQSRKRQMDELAKHLQSMNEEEDEDMGIQVKRIINMKEHLAKLKDMLNIVQNTENNIESQNLIDGEIEEHIHRLCAKTDNIMIQNRVPHVDNTPQSSRHENMAPSSISGATPMASTNERHVKEKQVNKKSMNANERERIIIQAEVVAKKRELEELMSKHAATSNLNHDVQSDGNSDPVGYYDFASECCMEIPILDAGPNDKQSMTMAEARENVRRYKESLAMNEARENLARRNQEKHLTKKSMNANERERMKIQAEVVAKKRELEELMSKHAATSNLNQDSKSDAGSLGNYFLLPALDAPANEWHPVDSNVFNLPQSSEQYSSDEGAEDDTNEYSEINSSELNGHSVVVGMPPLNYPTSNYVKRLPQPEVNMDCPNDDYVNSSSRTPRSPARSLRESTQSNSIRDGNVQRNQMQKQLELIKSVCDSMIDSSSVQPPNNFQVRNNLTPSPIYTDPRQYGSPRPNPANALNLLTGNECNVPPQPTTTTSLSNDPLAYQNFLTTNALQTQGFILNTLNQCCQMLWLQQKELASLRNTVNMQARCNGCDQHGGSSLYLNACPCSQSPHVNNSHNNNHFRPQPKVNHAQSSASSMPNLNGACNHHNTNMDHVCHCSNVQNGRILDGALNNSVHHHHHQNMIGEHVNNLPWNGQALNNQVPPGNRANNYWDNFRSYSRQNLLSSKSNEGLQNSCYVNQRSNNSSEISQPRPQPVPKLNTNNNEGSLSASVENTPKRSRTARSRRGNVQQPLAESSVVNDFNYERSADNLDALASSAAFNMAEGNDAFLDNQPRVNRNEWINDNASSHDNALEKSKLFDALRDNVYREVASLISANQGRPHFLIQLFRDLQLISSDPLRRRTLHSIQAVITNSLSNPSNATGARRQDPNSTSSNEEETDLFVEANEIASGIGWPFIKLDTDELIDSASHPELPPEFLTFLNQHDEDIFSDSLVHSLRDTLMHSTFAAVFANGPAKDGIIQKHFASLLTEALEQFRGQKVYDVRQNVITTVENLQRGEISLIRLLRENIRENDLPLPDTSSPSSLLLEVPPMQNGDLAEADQSCIEVDDDEEGAVGGAINIFLERNSNVAAAHAMLEEDLLPSVVECDSGQETSENGLDQVPTRLTNPSSRSNTPNRNIM